MTLNAVSIFSWTFMPALALKSNLQSNSLSDPDSDRQGPRVALPLTQLPCGESGGVLQMLTQTAGCAALH
jgi:hypothetical protein